MNWALVRVKENPLSNSDVFFRYFNPWKSTNSPFHDTTVPHGWNASWSYCRCQNIWLGQHCYQKWSSMKSFFSSGWIHEFTDYIVLISGGFASVEITNFVLNVMVMVLLYVCVKRFKWTPPKHRLVSEKALEVFLIQLRSCFPLESNQNDLHINQDYTQGTRWLFKM